MDGFDDVERVNLLGSAFNGTGPKRSKEVSDFVDTCRKLGLPSNVSESLIRGLRANTLGGEIDGVTGKVSHSREKSSKLMCKTLALLSLGSVSQTSLQHWAGLFCFGAGFRRPLFSIVQEIFPFIRDPRWEKLDRLPCPESVLDEIIVGALLIPFAGTNLRAPIRNKLIVQTPPNREGQQLSHQAL